MTEVAGPRREIQKAWLRLALVVVVSIPLIPLVSFGLDGLCVTNQWGEPWWAAIGANLLLIVPAAGWAGWRLGKRRRALHEYLESIDYAMCPACEYHMVGQVEHTHCPECNAFTSRKMREEYWKGYLRVRTAKSRAGQ